MVKEVTVIHGTPQVNLVPIRLVGLTALEVNLQQVPVVGDLIKKPGAKALPQYRRLAIEFNMQIDSVAQEMGIPDRRAGKTHAILPHWELGVDIFALMDENAVVAFDIDPERHYVYDFTDFMEAITEAQNRRAARKYWRSKVKVSQIYNRPEPFDAGEILVSAPVPPWRLRTYLGYKDFVKNEGPKMRARGQLYEEYPY